MGASTASGRQAPLKKLQRRIETRHARMRPPQDVWFWPERHGVRGFLGTGPLMIVGLNPSKPRRRARSLPESVKVRQWPGTETDRFFYQYTSAQRLGNAHITDLFKAKATAVEVPLLLYNPRTAERHRRYFKRELAIVRPRAVVALGQQVMDVLRGWGLVVRDGTASWRLRVPGRRTAAVIVTVHPAATRWPKRTAERRRRFRRDIRRARRLLRTNP